ncbi:trypsin-like peptidase domain-containing protein, partial [Streptomyces oryzae]
WRGSRIAVGVLVLVLLAGGAGGVIGAYVERNGGVSDVRLPQTAAGPAGEGGERPKGSIAGIARQTLPGVVTLHARGGGAEATGTGFVLDRRGHILTNNHVVESAKGGDGVRVTFNGGQTATGEVIGSDSGYDLAVVKVSGVSGLTPLPLGNSDAVRVGDPVIAFGAPFDLDGTVTTGIVSATERPITAGGEEPGSELSYVDALQTDAPINPGNSGGPLVDSRGRVVGVNSAIKGAGGDSGLPDGEGGGSGSVGLGFAIPVNQARRVAEELINEGRATHPVIGVSLDTEYEGEGARIGGAGGHGPAVVRDGPADKAGLEEGDVITKVGGKLVTSGEELIVRIRSHRPGEKLELTVRRGGSDGEQRTVRLTLGSATG